MNIKTNMTLNFESTDSPPDRTSTYAEVAARGQALRTLLIEMGIGVHRDSTLGVLLRDADTLAREWEGRDSSDKGIQKLVSAAHVDRISEAILMVSGEPEAVELIRRIASKDMDLSKRSHSHGKNALWELDLLSYLRRRNVTAKLMDPPDIVCQFPFGEYAIACKKVYSEKGVEAQMRKGVKQLVPFRGVGLVAFNIDDLVPENAIVQATSRIDAADFLAKLNHDFIGRHQAKIQRFIMEAKCDGVLVSTTVVSDILQSRPRFVTHAQTTLWSLTSASADSLGRLKVVMEAVGSN